jgi:hypothetical protein
MLECIWKEGRERERERERRLHTQAKHVVRERERERRNGVIRGGKAAAAAADLASCLSEAIAAVRETGRGIRSNKLRHDSFVYHTTIRQL